MAEHGRVIAAVVYLPRRDMLFSAVLGQGAFLNGAPIAATRQTALEAAEILAARPHLNALHWRGGRAPHFSRAYRPSLAYRMALVAQGRFDGMLTLRPSWEWDIAAGDLILREAGAVCTDRAGAVLRFNRGYSALDAVIRFNNPVPKVNGVIAAGAQIHRMIRDALAPEDPGAGPG